MLIECSLCSPTKPRKQPSAEIASRVVIGESATRRSATAADRGRHTLPAPEYQNSLDEVTYLYVRPGGGFLIVDARSWPT
jgi:hypothetical protein